MWFISFWMFFKRKIYLAQAPCHCHLEKRKYEKNSIEIIHIINGFEFKRNHCIQTNNRTRELSSKKNMNRMMLRKKARRKLKKWTPQHSIQHWMKLFYFNANCKCVLWVDEFHFSLNLIVNDYVYLKK